MNFTSKLIFRVKSKLILNRGLFLLYFIYSFILNANSQIAKEPILTTNGVVRKAIYDDSFKKHSSFYLKLWGNHYRSLYYTPVTVPVLVLDSMSRDFYVSGQVDQYYGLLLEGNEKRSKLLKLLGGISTFSQSDFFRNIYNAQEYKNTYIGDFIKEAYTVQHPFTFMAADYMAQKAGLYASNPQIYYVSESQVDTVAQGIELKDKLVSISSLPDYHNLKIITDTKHLIDTLIENSTFRINRELFVRARLFDMLVGDWNKAPDSWSWISHTKEDSVFFDPIVVDRSFAFTRVDGIAFKQLLNMLGLGFITDYDKGPVNVKKMNELGYALDVALLSGSDESVWMEQVRYLKDKLTKPVIDEAFSLLPEEVQDTITDAVKNKLKSRLDDLARISRDYYRHLQRTPVVKGTDSNERFVINRDKPDELSVKIYKIDNDSLLSDYRFYKKYTKEIWIYPLAGQDILETYGEYGGIPIYLIGGKGINVYNVKNQRSLKIYEGKAQRQYLDSLSILPQAKLIVPNDEKVLEYDYNKLKYSKLKFTPIGIYDSDLGLNLGTSLSYTIYGFKRSPFSMQHQLSLSYNSGLVYQGIFPDFDSKRSFHVSAFVGSPAYFSNFFGFGNNTPGNKDKGKKYNRVHIEKYALTPGFYYNIDKEQEFNVSVSYEIFKVDRPNGNNRYVNEVFPDADPVFDAKHFATVSMGYTLEKKMKHFVSGFKFSVNPGWTFNLKDLGKNFPFIKSNIGVNLKLADRLTFATLLKGTAIFTDDYEFYQAATTELRGFRDNRFIGKYSMYQYSDIRLDMGKLDNPFTPLNYGVFTGVDHGRVWYPGDDSKKWHTSYGGGFWLTLFRNFTGKFSYFASKDAGRFMFELGMVF